MFCSCFEHFGVNVHIEICISDNLFISSGSWVVKIERIWYTCTCQMTSGSDLVLNWSVFTDREVLEHLEMVSD